MALKIGQETEDLFSVLRLFNKKQKLKFFGKHYYIASHDNGKFSVVPKSSFNSLAEKLVNKTRLISSMLIYISTDEYRDAVRSVPKGTIKTAKKALDTLQKNLFTEEERCISNGEGYLQFIRRTIEDATHGVVPVQFKIAG